MKEHTSQENKTDLSAKNLIQLYIMPSQFNEKTVYWIEEKKNTKGCNISVYAHALFGIGCLNVASLCIFFIPTLSPLHLFSPGTVPEQYR